MICILICVESNLITAVKTSLWAVLVYVWDIIVQKIKKRVYEVFHDSRLQLLLLHYQQKQHIRSTVTPVHSRNTFLINPEMLLS